MFGNSRENETYKSDPDILKLFWDDLSESQRQTIVCNHHKEYNDFLNGNFTGTFSQELKDLIDLNFIMFLAIQRGCLKLVKTCIALGANIHKDRDFALSMAAAHDKFDIVKYLVEHGANIEDNNEMALRSAVNHNHIEIAKYLVEQALLQKIKLNPSEYNLQPLENKP